MEGRRQAPKRAVQEIRRRGPWGDIKYDHILDCGHTEVLVRASRAKRIACSWCARLGDKQVETKPITPRESFAFIGDDEVDDQSASSEIEVSRVRASLASIMKVPVDAVEIVANEKFGVLEIRAAYVFLSAGDIRRILTRGEINGETA
jgi:hypothetical protein